MKFQNSQAARDRWQTIGGMLLTVLLLLLGVGLISTQSMEGACFPEPCTALGNIASLIGVGLVFLGALGGVMVALRIIKWVRHLRQDGRREEEAYRQAETRA